MKWFSKFLRSRNRLGLRIVKTGIAVTACVAAAYVLKLQEPFIAVVATVMSMGKSIDLSVKSGKNKMIGAVIGSALGCAFAIISPANAGLCGIGIILTLYLCHLLRLDNAATLASFAFAAVMFGTAGVEPWRFAAASVIDCLIGIAVTIVVNLILFPPNYAEEIKNSYAALLEKTRAAIDDAAARRRIGIREVKAELDRLSENVTLYVSEAKFLRWNDAEVFEISFRASAFRLILEELRAVEVILLTEKEGDPDGELLTAYRYHLDRMKRLFSDVQKKDFEGAEEKLER